jgi:O-antigen/teichoic acid export membrane protein
MLVLGLLGTVVASLLVPWIVQDILKIPQTLQAETMYSFQLLALSIPIVIITAGLRGVLEAQQRFDLINVVRIFMTLATFLGPLLVLPFSQSLFPIVAVLAASRLLAWLVHLLLCFYVVPSLRTEVLLKRAVMRPLLLFGSWMTISNIIGPFLNYLDRFLISGMISVAAVAYYATPYETVTKLWVVPLALVGVLFPAFVATFAQDPRRTALLFGQGAKYTFLMLFPLTLLIVTLAHEGLNLWLGAEFAQNSTRVLQLLAVGVFVNCLAYLPFTLVQGPDLTAKFHLIELPFYLLALWWLIRAHGIEGAAFAWMARNVIEALVLFGMAQRLLPVSASTIRRVASVMVVTTIVLILGILLTGTVVKGVFILLTLLAFALVAWFLILTQEERAVIRNRLKRVSSFWW